MTLGLPFWHGNPMPRSIHIKCKPWIPGFQHAICVILLAHVVHLLLLADFACHYGSALIKKGFSEPVQMNAEQWI